MDGSGCGFASSPHIHDGRLLHEGRDGAQSAASFSSPGKRPRGRKWVTDHLRKWQRTPNAI